MTRLRKEPLTRRTRVSNIKALPKVAGLRY
jgi:hypothetical protein